MFESLLQRIDEEVVRRIFRIGVNVPQSEIPTNIMRENIDTKDGTGLTEDKKSKTPKVNANKLGRNDPCWCGSGKKFKRCHFPQQSPN